MGALVVVVRGTLERRRAGGGVPAPFADPVIRAWIFGGVAGLGLLAVAPLLWPGSLVWAQRLGTLASLVFLVAAGNLAVGMRGRAFVVAAVVVGLVYAASAWTPLAIGIRDFFVVAAITGFILFALAGFNLVFVLEEMVFDAHRLIDLRGRAWRAVPALLVLALTVGLPLWYSRGGPWLPALWWAAVAGVVLLGGWWFLAAFNDLPTGRVLPELHLFVIGLLGATLLAESVALLDRGRGLLGSLLAYLALLGTWVYVSYTTLQRTHFILGRRDAMPWVALLMAASYAVVVHVQASYSTGADASLDRILQLRLAYMMFGVWTGLAFYVARAVWRLLRMARHATLLGPWGRLTAGRAARVAEEVVGIERRLSSVVGGVLWRVESVLPGHRPRGWEIDPDGLHAIGDADE